MLRFGITGGYPPSNYHDEDTEELVGYEVDMAKELVKDLDGDVEAEFVEMSFGSILESLNSDRIDVAMHSLSETPERAEQYDFTVPYFDKVWGIIVAEDSDIQTLDDLDGKRAAQSVSTSSGQEAEELGGELVPIDDVDEAVKLITEDRADFYLGSDVGQQDYLDKQPEPLPVRVLDETVQDVPASLVVPKGSDELREALNESIIENTEDGTLAEIYDEYLDMDKSIEDFDEDE
ncbi:membrane component of an ABC superfamily polar amino acid transporter [Tetragenococcus muriaticus PMC-11-5]|uniref:Membrane component of an ABC superfamily polar amino acid transporter n=1 Tax=Tetragenococcus muriaticus PMC-11-5 TaxID=1302649 RepID=A0A091C394_9ENTE|nr:transporter substrate-binding domain-containing protein [Tetragenococcus muriaticus]KFN90547.1 membrane component of an ABC superfamily polar amino acid transporter [Tetragenococcus muriaticus PMC-11-5]